jgi:hypothetical protein
MLMKPTNRSRYGRAAYVAALALFCTVLGYWLFVTRLKAPPEPQRAPGAFTPSEHVTRAPLPEALARASDLAREADPTLPVNHRLRGRDAGDLVKNFDLSSVYPPNVRLLRADQQHLIQPDRYESDLTPLRLPSLELSDDDKAYAKKLADQGASRAEIRERMKLRKGVDHLPRYRFVVVDNDVTVGEAFVGWLEVVDERGDPLPHSIVGAQVFSDPAYGEVPLGAARSLAAIGGKTPIEWVAPSQDEIYWGDLRLELTIAVGKETVPLVHHFYSTPFAGVELTGKFSAEAVHGSFQFEAGIRVQRPGRCLFSVLLYDDARNQPIARATHMDVLEPGNYAVPFLFYGKVFHDADFKRGRLAQRELRGECTRHVLQRGQVAALGDEPASPAPEQFHTPTLALAYRTERPYVVGEFTSQPWQSPEKEHQRELLAKTQASRDDQR